MGKCKGADYLCEQGRDWHSCPPDLANVTPENGRRDGDNSWNQIEENAEIGDIIVWNGKMQWWGMELIFADYVTYCRSAEFHITYQLMTRTMKGSVIKNRLFVERASHLWINHHQGLEARWQNCEYILPAIPVHLMFLVLKIYLEVHVFSDMWVLASLLILPHDRYRLDIDKLR